jgi:hypothetical protein
MPPTLPTGRKMIQTATAREGQRKSKCSMTAENKNKMKTVVSMSVSLFEKISGVKKFSVWSSPDLM